MVIQPPSRAPLGNAVADILRNAILDGSLKPGHTLHENALARQLSVSRSPIREALLQLERERLVVNPINRPAVVRKPTRDEIVEIYTIRASLEGIAARWAAERATPELIRGLRLKAEELSSVTPVASAVVDPNIASQALDFHTAIADACGSVELQGLLRGLRNQITLVMTAGLVRLPGNRAKEIHAEHLSIISAIEDRDGDRAERLATAHVLGGRARMVHLESDGEVVTRATMK